MSAVREWIAWFAAFVILSFVYSAFPIGTIPSSLTYYMTASTNNAHLVINQDPTEQDVADRFLFRGLFFFLECLLQFALGRKDLEGCLGLSFTLFWSSLFRQKRELVATSDPSWAVAVPLRHRSHLRSRRPSYCDGSPNLPNRRIKF